MRGRLGLLGLDADSELVADQSMFVDSDEGRAELRAFVDGAFAAWGQHGQERAPGTAAIDLLRAVGSEPFEIRSMLRHELVEGERDVVRLTNGQFQLLNQLRNVRRASIVGGAGTGKTLLAAEKAKPARARGLPDAARVLQRPAGAGAGRRPRGDRARHGPARRQDVPPAVRGPRARGRRAGRAAGPDPAGLVGPDAAAGARRRGREAGAALSRGRRRRGPGLRGRVAGVAQRAAARRPGGRAVRVPRPGPGDLPRRRRRAARADRVPARDELPERRADPRRRVAVRRGRAGVGGDADRWSGAGVRGGRGRRRDRRGAAAACCIDCARPTARP